MEAAVLVPNTWLFITPKEVRISVICDGKREENYIDGTGVIQLAPDCVLKTNENILVSRRTETVPVIATYTKKVMFNINTTSMETGPQQELQKEEVLDNTNDLFRHLMEEETDEQTQLHDTIWKKVQNQSYMVSGAAAGICIAVICACYVLNSRWTRVAACRWSRKQEVQLPPAEPVYADIQLRSLRDTQPGPRQNAHQ